MGRFHYRLPPCPYYDMVGIQQWLEAQAQKGLFLDPEGYVLGMFQFQRGEPRDAKYRLEPIPDRSAVYPIEANDPEPEFLEISGAFGWEYLAKYKEFYIYRSFDPEARELNTDPEIQAMALEEVKKRSFYSLCSVCLLFVSSILGFFGPPQQLQTLVNLALLKKTVLCAVILFLVLLGALLFRERNSSSKRFEVWSRWMFFVFLLFLHIVVYLTAANATPLLDILKRGWLWWVFMGLFYIDCTVLVLIAWLHTRRLQSCLRRGLPCKRGKLGRFSAALPFLLLIALNWAASYGGNGAREIPLAEFNQQVPFVTMADLAPDREYIPRRDNNYVKIWSDPLAPVNYSWREEAWLDGEQGSRYGGVLTITYHEAASEAIAKELIREYSMRIQPEASDSGFWDDLRSDRKMPNGAFLRKGRIVIAVSCSVQSWGDHVNLFPVWLEKMEARLA